MPVAFRLLYPYIVSFFPTFLSFIGVKKFRDLNKDNIPNLFGSSDDDVIKIDTYNWSDDTHSTKPVNSVVDVSGDDFIDVDSKSDESLPDVSDISNISDYVLRKLNSLDSSSDVSVPDIDSVLESVSVSLPNVSDVDVSVDDSNLISLLKSNNIALRNTLDANFVRFLQVLGVIANSVSAMSISIPIALGKVSNELSSLKEVFSTLSLAMLALANKPVEINNNVDVSEPNVSVSNNINLDELVDVLNDKLSNVSESHFAIKEYLEYLKNPVNVNVDSVANNIPNVSVRDAIAFANLINSHLLAQEATISSDDLGLDDYDIDLSDVLGKLFNFEGISKDIDKMKGDGNGS